MTDPTITLLGSGSTQDEPPHQTELSDQQIINYIYDIALDPGNLDSFIDRLTADAADHSGNSAELGRIETLSALLESHLSRAEEFLDRLSIEEVGSASELALAPFEATPAILVNAALEIVDCNQRALDFYKISCGNTLDALPFEDADIDKLFTTLRQMLRDRTGRGTLLALQNRTATGAQTQPVLLHAHWLDLNSDQAIADQAIEIAGRRGFVLLVSTDVSWPLALDQTLQDVFGLTTAERDIVRALVEGYDMKTISTERSRSLATVRTQVKSILAKTRTHSQSELIRICLSLMEIVKRSSLAGSSEIRAGENSRTETTTPYASFESIIRPDGRRVDYLVQGDLEGEPLLFSHMGYGLLRWPPAALEMAIEHKIKIFSPVRPGFGNSDVVGKSDDILKITRNDTLAVMDHLGIQKCVYAAQGNDMIFAMDLAANSPKRICSLIGLGTRLPLRSDIQYAGMGKWHRFLLSTARHAPHLLYFTAKAAFTLGQKIGREQMFKNVHRNSPADLAILADPEVFPTLLDSSSLAVNEKQHAAFAYAKELFESESDWSNLVEQTRNVPAWFVSGSEDPLGGPLTIDNYQKAYPWIQIDILENAGQLLFFQKYQQLIPRIARSVHCKSGTAQ